MGWMKLAVLPVCLLMACGSSFTPGGDAGQDTSPGSDAVDTAADLPSDAPADTAVDAPPDGSTACTSHVECLSADYCGPCGWYTCPCDPEEDPVCAPHCIPNPCHDGTEPICPSPMPECAEWEVLTVHGGCFECWNVATCRPWGEPGCAHDSDCPPEEYCDSCATGSCPACEDCVPGCLEHECPTEPEAMCDMMRPDCGAGAVGVVRDGCWVCVDMSTCEPIDGGG